MEKENIILVIHINVGSKEINEIESYINKIKKDIETKNEKFISFFVPTRTGETKIECINPVMLSKKEYETVVSKILVETELKLNEFVENEKNKIKIKKVKK
jgi:hypothetical protein